MTRTVVAEGYGGPEVLALQDIELPDPGQGQVLVDVRAAGTNPIDYKLYSGEMGHDPGASCRMPIGLGGWQASSPRSRPAPTGYTGPLTVGDEVIVTNINGGYAEQVVANAADVGHKPADAELRASGGPAPGRRDGVAPVDEHAGGDG